MGHVASEDPNKPSVEIRIADEALDWNEVKQFCVRGDRTQCNNVRLPSNRLLKGSPAVRLACTGIDLGDAHLVPGISCDRSQVKNAKGCAETHIDGGKHFGANQ